MPRYLLRGYDQKGTLHAEEDFECSDDELRDELSQRLMQPAYLDCDLTFCYELKPVRVFSGETKKEVSFT